MNELKNELLEGMPSSTGAVIEAGDDVGDMELDYGREGIEPVESGVAVGTEGAEGDEAELEREVEKELDEVSAAGVVDSGGYNPMRMYDTRERQVSREALSLVLRARDHRNVLKYPGAFVDEHGGEKCLVVYIPDAQSGVEGILPESRAGLRGRERLEDLLSLPFVRVVPRDIDRENGICVLDRVLAEEIESRQTWKNVHEGTDVEAVVLGVRRDRETRRPYSVVVDVGGVLGEMPISEVSHNYVADINWRRGDVIKVRIIRKRETEIDGGVRRRYVVSRRALEVDPWSVERFVPKVGQECRGIIKYIGERYIHILLPTGIEVLAIHPSLNYLGVDRLKEGASTTVYVTYIDRTRRFVRGNMSRVEAAREIERFKRIARRRGEAS